MNTKSAKLIISGLCQLLLFLKLKLKLSTIIMKKRPISRSSKTLLTRSRDTKLKISKSPNLNKEPNSGTVVLTHRNIVQK
jgi:hypothetical protein